MSETSSEKKKFVIKYMFQAILSLLVLIGALFLFKTLYFDHEPIIGLISFMITDM